MSDTAAGPADAGDTASPVQPLSRLERSCAGFVGIALLAVGAIATFRSGNQAGTALLLVAGTGLMLMGIQGTPLIRVGGQAASIELERRRVRAALQEVADTAGAAVAREVAETVEATAPDYAPPATMRGAWYETEVKEALRRVGAQLAGLRISEDARASVMAVQSLSGAFAPIECAYRTNGLLSAATVTRIRARWIAESTYGDGVGLIIANVPPSKEAARLAVELSDPGIRLVTWRNAGDDQRLTDALDSLTPRPRAS